MPGCPGVLFGFRCWYSGIPCFTLGCRSETQILHRSRSHFCARAGVPAVVTTQTFLPRRLASSAACFAICCCEFYYYVRNTAGTLRLSLCRVDVKKVFSAGSGGPRRGARLEYVAGTHVICGPAVVLRVAKQPWVLGVGGVGARTFSHPFYVSKCSRVILRGGCRRARRTRSAAGTFGRAAPGGLPVRSWHGG